MFRFTGPDLFSPMVIVSSSSSSRSNSPVVATASGPLQRGIVVKAYDYYMDGVHEGMLFLKEPIRQCSWWSCTSGLRTDWHGHWVSYDGCGFVAQFEYRGRNTQKYAVIHHNHRGNDYRGRRIHVTFTGRWAFDDDVCDYVVL